MTKHKSQYNEPQGIDPQFFLFYIDVMESVSFKEVSNKGNEKYTDKM